jgi:N-hydroxyarylamine O-acetyltransferase
MSALDLDAYFARIGYSGRPRADLATLRELHYLHPLAIPFENLSTLLGQSVDLDVESVQRKLVSDKRGGYCFEQNRLFAAALEAIGFSLVELAARVVWNTSKGYRNPRTHMVLLVSVDGHRYLADVGFGGVTLTAPLRFEVDIEQRTPHEVFRLQKGDHEFVQHVGLGAQWRATYRFDLQPQLPIDFEAFNHYVATHPDSHFRRTLMVALATKTGRCALHNNRLTIYETGRDEHETTLTSGAEIRRTLNELFGICVPDDPRLETILDGLAA